MADAFVDAPRHKTVPSDTPRPGPALPLVLIPRWAGILPFVPITTVSAVKAGGRLRPTHLLLDLWDARVRLRRTDFSFTALAIASATNQTSGGSEKTPTSPRPHACSAGSQHPLTATSTSRTSAELVDGRLGRPIEHADAYSPRSTQQRADPREETLPRP